MPWMGFEPTIPVFELAKTFHALDRAATVIGTKYVNPNLISHSSTILSSAGRSGNFFVTASCGSCNNSSVSLSRVMTSDPWFTQVPTSIINTPASGWTHSTPDAPRLWLREGTRTDYGGIWRHSLANLICRLQSQFSFFLSFFFLCFLSLLQLDNDGICLKKRGPRDCRVRLHTFTRKCCIKQRPNLIHTRSCLKQFAEVLWFLRFLTPWSSALVQKLTPAQPDEKFPVLYGT
jgi:hypothetical protein